MYWRLAASISISTSTVLPQLLILLALLLLWQPCAKFSKTSSLVRRRRQPAATKMYEIQNTKPKRRKPKTDKKYKTKRQKKKKEKKNKLCCNSVQQQQQQQQLKLAINVSQSSGHAPSPKPPLDWLTHNWKSCSTVTVTRAARFSTAIALFMLMSQCIYRIQMTLPPPLTRFINFQTAREIDTIFRGNDDAVVMTTPRGLQNK